MRATAVTAVQPLGLAGLCRVIPSALGAASANVTGSADVPETPIDVPQIALQVASCEHLHGHAHKKKVGMFGRLATLKN